MALQNTPQHLKYVKQKLTPLKNTPGKAMSFCVVRKKGSRDVIMHLDKPGKVKELKSPAAVHQKLLKTPAFKLDPSDPFFGNLGKLTTFAGVVTNIAGNLQFEKTVGGKGAEADLKIGLKYLKVKEGEYTIGAADGVDTVDTSRDDEMKQLFNTRVSRTPSPAALLASFTDMFPRVEDFDAMIDFLERKLRDPAQSDDIRTAIRGNLTALRAAYAELDAWSDSGVEGVNDAMSVLMGDDDVIDTSHDPDLGGAIAEKLGQGLDMGAALDAIAQEGGFDDALRELAEDIQVSEEEQDLVGTQIQDETQDRWLVSEQNANAADELAQARALYQSAAAHIMFLNRLSEGYFWFCPRTSVDDLPLLMISRNQHFEKREEAGYVAQADVAVGHFRKSRTGNKLALICTSGSTTRAALKAAFGKLGIDLDPFIVDSFADLSNATRRIKREDLLDEANALLRLRLDDVLGDDRLCALFWKFLGRESGQENLGFYLSAKEDRRRFLGSEYKATKRQIYDYYVKTDATKMINLYNDNRKALEAAVAAPDFNGDYNSLDYSVAITEIAGVLRDPLPRFLGSAWARRKIAKDVDLTNDLLRLAGATTLAA